jgi:cytochrome c oxidase subunit 2
MKSSRLIASILFFDVLSCSRNPSALLDNGGPHAKKISNLFWYFFSVNSVVFILVLSVLFIGLWRRRHRTLEPAFEPSPEMEKRHAKRVGAAVAVTAIILCSYVIFSYLVDRDLIALDQKPSLEIEVTAHQWWWELRYLSKEPSEVFTTANEIHIPTGETVRLILKSNDVVHSLWLPNLAGKKDIIPGREQDMYIRADKNDVWQGRCAEFCGLQHALMLLKVYSEPRDKFESWQREQRLAAVEPVTTEEFFGRQVFRESSCLLCHGFRENEQITVSNNAPDLTHLKSRSSIGAGAAPNTKGYLGGWINDPHGIKPGVHMPAILHEPRKFQALLKYMEALK